ncbi:zinc ribbon domain-containing protein [Providencia alcalifaciens]|nr:zinc ribbon domain-containing protein [Providencia alcalifaciens]
MMKGFGWILLVVGIIAAFAAFNMDVSVSTSYGNRVNNIGLMAQRQNFVLISCFIMLCGLLMVIFGSRKSSNSNSVKCPYCAEFISNEAIKCKHCGSDLSEYKANKAVRDANAKNKFSAINYDQRELFVICDGKASICDDKLLELIDRIKNENPEVTGDALLKMQKFNISTIESFLPKEIKKEFKDKVEKLILS